MKKIIILLGIIIVTIIVWPKFSEKINQLIYREEITISKENIKQKVFLAIDNGQIDNSTGLLENFEIDFKEGMTALDLLKMVTHETNMILKTKVYDIGTLVEAINGIENGKDGKYWLYYVNGKMPTIASDKNKIKVGDKVEFKFEKSTF